MPIVCDTLAIKTYLIYICVIALSRHCLTAAVGAVSLMPLSICFGLCSSIDFGHASSASLDLVCFEDACRLLPDLCRRQLGCCYPPFHSTPQRRARACVGCDTYREKAVETADDQRRHHKRSFDSECLSKAL